MLSPSTRTQLTVPFPVVPQGFALGGLLPGCPLFKVNLCIWEGAG